VYRTELSPLEQLSLLRLRHLFSVDVYLAAPQGLCLDAYLNLWPELQVKFFDSAYFASVKTYNKLMLELRFYETFVSAYEWMLIHQLDAFLFHGDLESFCAMPFDYFGAPWVPAQWVHPKISSGYFLKLFGTRVSVGNGGLSLRRLEPTISLLKAEAGSAAGWPVNEDAFFGYWGMRSPVFRSCPLEIAARFSFEANPGVLFEMTGRDVPFGCHGLPKYHQAFYAKLMRPLLAQMPELAPGLIETSMSELLGAAQMDT